MNHIERIKKLLSLANSSNEFEAKAARDKANELKKKYCVSDDELAAPSAATTTWWQFIHPPSPPSQPTTSTSSTSTTSTTSTSSTSSTPPPKGAIVAEILLEFPGKNKKAWVVELAVLLGDLFDCVIWTFQNTIRAAGRESNLDLLVVKTNEAIATIEDAWSKAAWSGRSGGRSGEASYKLGAVHALVERINVEKPKPDPIRDAQEAFARTSGFFQGLVASARAGYNAAKHQAEGEIVRQWVFDNIDLEAEGLVHGYQAAKISDNEAYEAGRRI